MRGGGRRGGAGLAIERGDGRRGHRRAALVFAALRELFRLFLEIVPEHAGSGRAASGRRWPLRAAVAFVVPAALVALLFFWRRPMDQPVIASDITACNGAPELCDRRIDQASFPAADNAMSNAEIPGWMFPHHSVAFPGHLQNGVRALLIDIHYGFPGAARIKTDL